MYHIELRQFPHNFCQFNLTERELRETLLDGWTRGEWIELGERKWNPHQAHLTVLEGPRLALQQLSMGRGWRTAVRQGHDVTERLVTAARAAMGSSAKTDGHATGTAKLTDADGRAGSKRERRTSNAPAEPSGPGIDVVADSLGLALLAMLDKEPITLASVWRLACERHPGETASDGLKLAERAIRSLVQRHLAVVLVGGGAGEPELCASEEEVERVLGAIESWSGACASVVRKA